MAMLIDAVAFDDGTFEGVGWPGVVPVSGVLILPAWVWVEAVAGRHEFTDYSCCGAAAVIGALQ